jgi:uncharacterized protein YndB with AHSA1/START domain
MLVESISIAAPIATVFAALTEPDELVRWWGSEDGYHTTTMQTDMRVGGAWKTSGIGRDGDPFTVGGIYRVVDPPQHLEFTWRHDWGDGDDATNDTIVRYDLEERDGATTVTVTHTNFATEEDRDDHAKGWPVVLGWMAAYVTR